MWSTEGKTDTVGINEVPTSFKPIQDPFISHTFTQGLFTKKKKKIKIKGLIPTLKKLKA